MRRLINRILFAFSFFCLAANGLRAEDAVSFKDKTVTMVVGNAAGGGTDVWARFLGQYLMERLPGAPKLVVLNQPGAEGVIALNSFYARAKPDGLNITLGAGTQSDPLFYRSAQGIFDLSKMEFAGGVGRSGSVIIINKAALARLRDPTAKPVTMGALAAVRPSMYMALWGHEYLGWNLRWVLGYPTTAILMQALARDEIDMSSIGELSDVEAVMKTGRFEILAQLGRPDGDRLVGLPEFGDAPILTNQIDSKIKEPLARAAFDYWKRISFVGTWLGLPPGVAPQIVDAYQTAMRATVTDPALRNKASTIISDMVDISGPDMKSILTQLAATSPEVLAYLQDIERRQGLLVAK